MPRCSDCLCRFKLDDWVATYSHLSHGARFALLRFSVVSAAGTVVWSAGGGVVLVLLVAHPVGLGVGSCLSPAGCSGVPITGSIRADKSISVVRRGMAILTWDAFVLTLWCVSAGYPDICDVGTQTAGIPKAKMLRLLCLLRLALWVATVLTLVTGILNFCEFAFFDFWGVPDC